MIYAKANEQLRILWIACGWEDRPIDGNRKFLDWLKSREIRYTWVETGGAHTWMVWRRYLSKFVPSCSADRWNVFLHHQGTMAPGF